MVRSHPDELIFISPSAWQDIYVSRAHLPKCDVGSIRPLNRVPNLGTTTNVEDHGRMKRVLNHAFSDRAMKEQEAVLQKYTSLLVNRLSSQINESGGTLPELNVSDCYYFTTFDTIGDPVYGESFGSLERSKHHPWVDAIFRSLKFGILTTVPQYYPILTRILPWLIPSSLKDKAQRHYKWSVERTQRRVDAQQDNPRPDFTSFILRKDGKGEMTKDEMYSNAPILLIARSETTAAACSALTWFALTNPRVMDRLKQEIRGAFKKSR